MKKKIEKTDVVFNFCSFKIINMLLDEILSLQSKIKRAKSQGFWIGWLSGLSLSIVIAILFVVFR